MIKDRFFGRKTYLDLLEKRISDLKEGYRQNIAIVGDELIGKTSIILKLLDRFYDHRIITLYLEARPESSQSFAKRFIGVLLYNFLLNSGISLKENLEFLILKSEKYIPQTSEKIKSILSAAGRRKMNNIFSELLSLTESIHQETGKFCVVIMDEFHNLESIGFKNLYREWSKLLIVQKNTMYIIISSSISKTKTILSKNLSLLFGNFETITVEPFDIKSSEQFLAHRLQNSSLNTGLRNFLVHFTGGNPFYLEVIADMLSRSPQENLADILENLLFDASGILNHRFSNYIKRFLDLKSSNDSLSILYLIASGRNKIKDIPQVLKIQRKDLTLKVNRLLELDAITRSGDFLKINDRVFGFWLRFVYQEKLRSLTFDAKKQKVLFRDNILGLIQEFLDNTQKPIAQRLTELLRLFENEIIQIERKKMRLNHFREIKPLEFNYRNLKDGLIGRSTDSLWILAIQDERLTEEDISDFSKECKKYRHKLQRKIILTLQDIDDNTRLKALEEKIQTWDLNHLNQILDLFSKPRVIA